MFEALSRREEAPVGGGGGGGGGVGGRVGLGTLNFSSYVGKGPASTVHTKRYKEF